MGRMPLSENKACANVGDEKLDLIRHRIGGTRFSGRRQMVLNAIIVHGAMATTGCLHASGAKLTPDLRSHFAESQEHAFNDIAAFVNLFFGDDQRWRQTDDVSVGRFGKKSFAHQVNA